MSAVEALVGSDFILAPAGPVPAGWRTGIAYYRISEDGEGDLLGVMRQRGDVRAYAETNRVVLVREYVDDDRSAFVAKRRPGYEAFLAHGTEAGVDVVLAWHPDRMSRGNGIEIERIIETLGGDNGKPIETVQTGAYDLAHPSGRMIARILGAAARYESEHKSERARLKMAELAKAGAWKGGRRPFGYEPDGVTIREAEAVVLAEAVARVLSGESTRAIAADLNARGITTATGKSWHPGALANLLRSPRIAGLRVHNPGNGNGKRRGSKANVIGPAAWPGVIDVETHRRVVAALDARTPVGRRGRVPYLLTGVLVCGLCGAQMVAQASAGARRYACRKGPGLHGCGRLTIKAEPTEELLRQAVMVELRARAETLAAEPDPVEEPELAELASIEAQRLAYAAQALTMTPETMAAVTATLDQAKRDAEVRLAARNRRTSRLDLIAGVAESGRPFRDLEPEQQRGVIAAMIERVVIAPATKIGSTRFEDDRVGEPVWREL